MSLFRASVHNCGVAVRDSRATLESSTRIPRAGAILIIQRDDNKQPFLFPRQPAGIEHTGKSPEWPPTGTSRRICGS